jgi:hypothetical protein
LTRRVISDIVFPWVTGMASDGNGNGEKGKRRIAGVGREQSQTSV